MKKLSPVLIGLTALLTACPQPPTPTPTHALTVAVTGVTEAPVKVTNTTTNSEIYNGVIASSKTFADIKEGSVITVTPQTVNTYTTPAAQTLTLNADQTVTLNYAKAALHTYYNATGVWNFEVTPDDPSQAGNEVAFKLTQDAKGGISGYVYDLATGTPIIDPAGYTTISGSVDTGVLMTPNMSGPNITLSKLTGAFSGETYAGTYETYYTTTAGEHRTVQTGTFVGTRQ